MNNVFQQKNPILFQQLRQLVNNNRNSYINVLNAKKYEAKYANLKQWIKACTPKLSDNKYKDSTRIFWILNGLQDFPKCKVCGQSKKYEFKNVTLANGYKATCCAKCAAQDKDRAEKIKNTCIEKYGCENPYQNVAVKEKCKQTKLKHFGVDHQLKCNNIKNKIENTKLKKYGSKTYNNRDAAKQTCLERYGCENPHQTDYVKEKCKQTCIEKYGVEFAIQNPEIYNKLKSTNFHKYGTECVLTRQENIQRNRQKAFDAMCNNEFDIPVFSFDEYCNNDNKFFNFKCKKCGNIFQSYHINGIHKHCNKCYPIQRSKQQNELFDFLQSLNVTVIENSRKEIPPLELDIFFPNNKLAIEYDGLFWHSTLNLHDINYHLNKTLACEEKGIQLIHVFENEWLYKQNIVKARIKNLLGIYDKTIYARKCEVREVSSKESRAFQEENHLQGAVNAKVNLGLFYENELISLMTFGKCRFDKKHEWEMLRFCNKLGYHIVGGAGKLLKHFERNLKPKSLVSYADRRWSQGKLYKALGFKLDHISAPNYWYWNKKSSILQLENRLKYQKHKLKNILKNYDNTLTESQNMENNNFLKIYDCGNFVYEKIFKK